MNNNNAKIPHRLSAHRRPIAVLLVDDQRFIGLAVERLLATEQDIELHCCDKAADAVTRANQIGPAIILQDLVMPDIDGLTLVGMFRGNPPTAHVPVVVLSGNDDADARTQALAAGASDYLVKLPAKDDLIACIRRHAIRQDAAPRSGPGHRAAALEGDGDETLDPVVIATFREADPSGSSGFMLMLMDQFTGDAESRMATLRDAVGRRDADVVKKAAHSLKGSSMTMGAKRLGALCGQMEGAANGASDDSVTPALMSAIEEELVRVFEAFARERQAAARL